MKKRNWVFDPKTNIDSIVYSIKDYFSHDSANHGANAVIGISGGKDSTVVAMLCIKALGRERVIGVMMPDGYQNDIDDSRAVCDSLGIMNYEVNIGPICSAFYDAVNIAKQDGDRVATNTPPRVRMAMLYAIATMNHGRVMCTSNYSEGFIGWSTKFGDECGDYAPLGNYTATEVVEMGKVLAEELGLDMNLITKAPDDGMCGLTDEEKFGFSYAELDAYIRNENISDMPIEIMEKISAMRKGSRHKHSMPHSPCVARSYLDEQGNLFQEECFEF